MDLNPLRLSMRAQRAQLGELVQQLAADSAFYLAQNSNLLDNVQHAAFYHPYMGEISPLRLMEQAMSQDIHCYLPSMSEEREQPLVFRRINNETELKQHHWGIVQPGEDAEEIAAQQLDLVLVPLVAFDRQGNRLGMGKGYYDRTFAFLNQPQRTDKPRLIGMAYDFQEVAQLTPNRWDVALDGLLTDTRYLDFGSDRNNS